MLVLGQCRENNDGFARGCVMAKHAWVSASVNDPEVPGHTEFTHFGLRCGNKLKSCCGYMGEMFSVQI